MKTMKVSISGNNKFIIPYDCMSQQHIKVDEYYPRPHPEDVVVGHYDLYHLHHQRQINPIFTEMMLK